MSSFEIVPYAAVFLLVCAWTYRFLFNHEIIRNYTNKLQTSKAQINSKIQDANAKYACHLLHVNVEDELETLPVLTPARKSYSELHQKHIHRVVGALFSVVIALSVELVILLMVQMTGGLGLDLRLFKLSIRVLVVLVTMVQPLLIVSLYVNQDLLPTFNSRSPGSLARTTVTAALCVGWFFVLNRFGSLASDLADNVDKSYLERKTNEIVITGISITAILSGMGCTLTPFRQFWGGGYIRKSTNGMRDSQINDLIQSYNNTKMLLQKRDRELTSNQAYGGGTVYNQPPQDTVRLLRGSSKQLLHKVQSFASLSNFNPQNAEEEELKREVESLRLLKELIYSDLTKGLDKFLTEKQSAPGSSMSFERLLHIFNLVFSIYCIYRIVNVLLIRLPYHYFWSTEELHDATKDIIDTKEVSTEALNKNTKDALAITIAKLIQSVFGYEAMSETQLINQVSFIISGSLFVCSFQNVLVTFKSFGRILPGNTTSVSLSVKSWLKNLVISEFFAIYVIATALLIRSNLPPEIANLMLKIVSLTGSSSTVTSAVTEMNFIDALFDKVFGLTCVVTFLVISLKSFIESDNVYDDDYDEESMIEAGPMFKLS